MASSSSGSSSSTPADPTDNPPRWVGYWRVLRYGGAPPDRPTYYDARSDFWDVIKDLENDLYVARHPILDIEGGTITLKDEGEPDANAETWRASVEDNQLRVVAATGPHEGAVGVAERIQTNPRALSSH